MKKIKAYSVSSSSSAHMPDMIERRTAESSDVEIEILFGVCHSDIHTARNEWSNIMETVYPCVPGHEIIGRVSLVGCSVENFEIGDLVGVGCLVNLIKNVQLVTMILSNFVLVQFLPTMARMLTWWSYLRRLFRKRLLWIKNLCYGFQKISITAEAAPLLCAGITTYSPIRRWGNIKDKKVGIVGLGGLGHMGVKFAKAFGAQVSVFTRLKLLWTWALMK